MKRIFHKSNEYKATKTCSGCTKKHKKLKKMSRGEWVGNIKKNQNMGSNFNF
jgi:hypothetical protein